MRWSATRRPGRGTRRSRSSLRSRPTASSSGARTSSPRWRTTAREERRAGAAGAAGIRLLAVAPAARGRGVGKALTRECVERARALGRSSVVLHTTRAMQTAWRMYEQLGFRRSPDLDFRQGALEVFGFELSLR